MGGSGYECAASIVVSWSITIMSASALLTRTNDAAAINVAGNRKCECQIFKTCLLIRNYRYAARLETKDDSTSRRSLERAKYFKGVIFAPFSYLTRATYWNS